MNNETMLSYKPCRITECFKDSEGIINVISGKGIIKLKGAGRIIWNMSDGSNTIEDITKAVLNGTLYENFNEIYNQCIQLLLKLNRKELMIMNWNSLYRRRMKQYAE